MRSSPRFLAENRSDGHEGWVPDEPDPEGSDKSVSIRRAEPPRMDDGADITVRLKVGYKTVLLVVVVFDLIHLSVRELVDSGPIRNFLGLD